MALLLATSLHDAALRAGVTLAVAIALVGMAGGRAISALIARQMGRYPWYFFIVEIVLAVMLLTARYLAEVTLTVTNAHYARLAVVVYRHRVQRHHNNSLHL